MQIIRKLGSLPTVLAILAMPPSWADTHDGYAARAPLFADDSLLEVRIEAPISTLMDVRPDKAYLDGSFTYKEPDGTTRKLSLKLRTRGNYRRDPSHCDFAPVRLNFTKGELKGTLFEDQDKLKLVTHCRTIEGIPFEQLVAREYFAYRLLHEITSISYAVRMFDITYVDTESGSELRRLGFVIEDDKAVAKRNGLRLVKLDRVAPEELEPGRQNLVHLFSYLIANTEYSFVNPEPGKECCHNIDVLSASGEPPYLPLPFDFDFAGMVDAPYAQPNPRYPIRLVRTRFYKGVCSNNALLADSIETFLAHEDGIRRLIDETGFISPKSQRSIESMVDKFYEIIIDPIAVAEELAGKCNEREDVYGETPDP